MPKQKTHKGASKRFRLTASGLVKRSKAYKRHILTKKSTKRKRNLRKSGLVSVQETKTMRTLIPYK